MSSLQRVLVFELAHLAFSDYSLFKLTWYLEKEILRDFYFNMIQEHLCPYQNLYMDICSSFVHNC